MLASHIRSLPLVRSVPRTSASLTESGASASSRQNTAQRVIPSNALSTNALSTASVAMPVLPGFPALSAVLQLYESDMSDCMPRLSLVPALMRASSERSLSVYLYDSGLAGTAMTQRVAGLGARLLMDHIKADDESLQYVFPGGVTYHELGFEALQRIFIQDHQRGSVHEHLSEGHEQPPAIKHQQVVIATQSLLHDWFFSHSTSPDRKTLLIGGDHGGSLAHMHLYIARQLVNHAIKANLSGDRSHPLYFLCNAEQRWFWILQLKTAESVAEQVSILAEIIASGGLSFSALDDFKRTCPILFIDAHADLHTPSTSPSSHFHGMVLATAMGHGLLELIDPILSPNSIAMIGQRDVEPEEWHHAEQWGVHAYPCDSDHFDFRAAYHEARSALAQDADAAAGLPISSLHLEFDTDALDARFVPKTGTPVGTGSARTPNVGPDLDVVSETLRCVVDEAASISLMEVGHLQDEEAITVTNMKRLTDAMLGL